MTTGEESGEETNNYMAAIVWKGYISFGLVSFQVRLLAAARPKPIRFHMLHKKDLSRVREVFYCAEENKPITRDEIVKGYETNKDKYVVVTDEELKKVAPVTATTMEISQFVPASAVDPIFLENSYYVAPDGPVLKPYMLLLRTLEGSKYYALAKIAMHGREHLVIIRPTAQGLILHTMYFVDELQKANAPALSNGDKFSAKEMELAKTLVNSLAGPFKPEQYHDEYRENIERLLEAKQRGQKITLPGKPKTKPVVNIMEALKRSLQQAHQGPSSSTATGHVTKKKARTRKAA